MCFKYFLILINLQVFTLLNNLSDMFKANLIDANPKIPNINCGLVPVSFQINPNAIPITHQNINVRNITNK